MKKITLNELWVAERRKTANLVNHICSKHIKAGYERPDGSYEDKMTEIREKK